jgi:hypothetical protein
MNGHHFCFKGKAYMPEAVSVGCDFSSSRNRGCRCRGFLSAQGSPRTGAILKLHEADDEPHADQDRRSAGSTGPATALIAAIGNGAAFRKGREFAAWVGWSVRTLNRRRTDTALLAGKAGLLDGYVCTTHHNSCAELAAVARQTRVLENRLGSTMVFSDKR